jgi:hypothetical protein
MKRIILVILALVIILAMTACKGNSGTAQTEQSSSPVEQSFPPDYSNAKSIKITIYGGTATGQSFIVTRNDSRMMWNREELPISYDSNGTPYLPANSFRFNEPDEYLFDVLMDEMFNNWEYSPGKHLHTDDEGHYNIVIYDDEDSEIMTFDLFYQNCILFNGAFYSISPDDDHVTAPIIDGYPFTTAYFIYRNLYSAV